MLKAYYYFLNYRIDLGFLILFVATACFGIERVVRRRGSHYRIPRKSFIAAALLVLAGGLVAEWAAHDRVNRLQKLFAGFGPTYASDLATMGHAGITLETPADDTRYLALIEAEKRWLAANPIIADIYTFRQDAQGRLRLIVDSETDYNRSGKIDEDRERRTPIGEIYAEGTPSFFAALQGQSTFESTIVPDRWGIWVSSFTPVYDQAGKVEAAVGIDYPADSWLIAIGSVRVAALSLTLVVIAILLASSTLISFLTAEIEDRKKNQRQLELASESALSSSAAKSSFLALMSHEVRNPLTAILGYTSILTDTELDSNQRRYVETINRAGLGLLELLNDVLDYTKAESGKLTLEHIEWNPALLIHEVMELMTARATQKGLQLNFDNELPAALTLFGDPVRIRQIVLNFVSNAVKFTAVGHVTVKAAWQPAANRENHGRFLLEVADTGIGIPAEKIPALFQAFTQAEASTTRHHGGTGLGLAICQRLSDMMGGTLGLRSVLNAGTTFTFALDCDALPVTGEGEMPRSDSRPPIPIWNRVLVVDDARLSRELLKVMLRRLGLEADLAADGPEAVRLAAQTRYAIIFLDLEMPGMDGFATARQIRSGEEAGQSAAIVAVSARTTPGTRENCIAAGMDDYLTKPVYAPALESTIEVMLPGQHTVRKTS
ncbi:MAG TPA: ATP-binding protein [Opitutaceae bacterium]|nr:ATP-binding protein [Opitutaceae bacterium]